MNIGMIINLYLLMTSVYFIGDRIHGGNLVSFLQGNSFDMLAIGNFFGMMGLATAISNFPCGVLADRYGRILILFLGYIFYGLGLISVPYSDSLLTLSVAGILIGTGMGFSSGSAIAWLKGSIEDKGVIGHTVSRARALSWFCSAIASLIAFVIIRYLGDKYIYFVGGTLFILTALFLKTTCKDNTGKKNSRTFDLMKDGVLTFFKNKKLSKIFIFNLFFNLNFLAFVLCWQPFLTTKGISKELFPILLFVFMILAALGSYVYHWTSKKIGIIRSLVIATLISGVSILLLGMGPISDNAIIAIVLMSIFEFGLGYSTSAGSVLFAHALPPSHAATIVSFASSLSNLVGYFLAMAIGWGFTRYGGTLVFKIFGIITVMLALLSTKLLNECSENESDQKST